MDGRMAYPARPRDFAILSHRLRVTKESYSQLLSNSPLSQENAIAPAMDTPPDVLPMSVRPHATQAGCESFSATNCYRF
jgi:hypothetical protein